jgi:2-methylisocitrate lyase-like PEP mutase family enzyme
MEPPGSHRTTVATAVSTRVPAAADPAVALRERAAALRALHVPGDPVILPNAWDQDSARTVVAAGFPAVATSSAAVAASLGYADGEMTPVAEMLDAVARIVDAVRVPVTADIERGYGMAPEELVERLCATGAVGCNLEDSDPHAGAVVDANEQADLLSAVGAAIHHSGLDLVINARVDTFLHGSGTPEQRLDDALRRAQLYRDAGADCVFPIVLAEPGAIRTLVEAVGRVNVLFTPSAPSLTELAGLGVARVSFGSGVYRATRAYHREMLARIAAGASPYPDSL